MCRYLFIYVCTQGSEADWRPSQAEQEKMQILQECDLPLQSTPGPPVQHSPAAAEASALSQATEVTSTSEAAAAQSDSAPSAVGSAQETGVGIQGGINSKGPKGSIARAI